MHFRQNRKQQSNFQFKYGSTTLEYCPYYKYLGLYLDANLNFNNGIRTLADSGGRAFGAVISKLKHLKDVRYKTFTTIFNSQIANILDYSSSIWSHKKAPEGNVIQNKAMRYFLGVHRFTPVTALNGEMGWLPSRFRRYLNTIRLRNRLIKIDNSRLTKTIFLWDSEQTQSSWCQNVKEIFSKLDFDNEYNLKQIVDIEKAKTNLFKLAEHEWKQDVESKPKLRLYKTFETNLKPANHLQSYIPRYKCSLLSQFRAEVLPLCIETGRYHLIKDSQTKKYRKLNTEEKTCLNVIQN